MASLDPWFHNLRLQGFQTAADHTLRAYPRVTFESLRHALLIDMHGVTASIFAATPAILWRRSVSAQIAFVISDEHYLQQARFAAEAEGINDNFKRIPVWDLAKLVRDLISESLWVCCITFRIQLALNLIHEHVARDPLLFKSMQRGSDEVVKVEENDQFAAPAPFDDPAYTKMHFVGQR